MEKDVDIDYYLWDDDGCEQLVLFLTAGLPYVIEITVAQQT